MKADTLQYHQQSVAPDSMQKYNIFDWNIWLLMLMYHFFFSVAVIWFVSHLPLYYTHVQEN